MEVRLAGYGPRGRGRSQRAGLSSEEPGRERCDCQETEADQAESGLGRSRMPLGSHMGFRFGLENPAAYIWLVVGISGPALDLAGDLQILCLEVRAEAKGVSEQ